MHELLRAVVADVAGQLEQRVDLIAHAGLLLECHAHRGDPVVEPGLLCVDVGDPDLLVCVEQVLDHHHRVVALLHRLPVEECREAGQSLGVVVDGGPDVLLVGAELVCDLLVEGYGEGLLGHACSRSWMVSAPTLHERGSNPTEAVPPRSHSPCSPQRKPVRDGVGSRGLSGRPSGTLGSLYPDGATSLGVSGWNSEARYWICPRPGPSSP